MKQSFKHLLLLLALIPAFTAAENYFVDGACWEYYGEAEESGVTVAFDQVYTIEGTATVGDYECLNLFLYSTFSPEPGMVPKKKFVTYVRTEGEKVFFLPDPDTEQWALLYDFSLEPGEYCTVGTLLCSPISFDNEVTCLERFVSEPYGGVTAMKVDDRFPDEDPYEVARENVWLVGIGSTEDLNQNFGYHARYGSATGWLVRFTVNGEEICALKTYTPDNAGITNVEAERPAFTVNGLTVSADTPFALYGIDGRMVAQGSASITVAAHGLYVALTPRGASKVLVR